MDISLWGEPMKYTILAFLGVLLVASMGIVTAKSEETYSIAIHTGDGKSNAVQHISVTKAQLDLYRRADRMGHAIGLKFIESLKKGESTMNYKTSAKQTVEKTSYVAQSKASTMKSYTLDGTYRPTVFAKARIMQKAEEQKLTYEKTDTHASEFAVVKHEKSRSATISFTVRNALDTNLFVSGYGLETPAVAGFAINGVMPTSKIQVHTGVWSTLIECEKPNKLIRPGDSLRCGYTFPSQLLKAGENTFSFYYGTTSLDKGTQESYTFTV